MKQAYPGTRAVLRAVGLLKAFSAEAAGLRLQDLSRVAGLHKATAYRLLTALESEGMVERGPDGESWRLGPEAVVMGYRALGSMDLRLAARSELGRLAGETLETVTLEVLAGAETLIVDEALGGHVVGTLASVGSRWPAHATSTGKALLAALSPEAGAAVLGPRLARATPRTIVDHRRLERELLRIRERGYATSIEELEPGFAALGAVVHDASGRPVGAISVGGPRSRLTPARIVELSEVVVAAAARVSARLGYRGETGRGAKPQGASRKARTA
jgi:IclR family acetate operon transcriptional repressor